MTRRLPTLRPTHRGDCESGGPMHVRPCPWLGCRYHLGVDIRASGRLVEHPPRPGPSCALDAAEAGPRTLTEVAGLIGCVTRERTRQIETKAMRRIAAAAPELAELLLREPDRCAL